MGFGFTGLGGWADRLVNKAEVGAFAGAMWEVQDALALVCQEFLHILATGRQDYRPGLPHSQGGGKTGKSI